MVPLTSNTPGICNIKSAHLLNVLVHEYMHHLVQSFMGNITTPKGVGPSDCQYPNTGESGWLAEWAILGGSLAVDFFEGDEWNLREATDLIFQLPREGPSHSIMETPEQTSQVVINSLRKAHIHQIKPMELNLPVLEEVPADHIRMRLSQPGCEVQMPPCCKEKKKVRVRVGGPIQGVDGLKFRC